MQIESLTEGRYFHMYNRGVNGEDIFKEPRNYDYFLQQYSHYCSDVFETLAYALLKNHFHLLVYVKENVTVPKYGAEGTIRLNASKQLSHFFNSYSQSINRAFNRTGPLFESPFERKPVDDDNYVTAAIYYCHYNPQLHGFVKDFKDWVFTSYSAILNNNNTITASQKVLDWFGGTAAFKKMHEKRYEQNEFKRFFNE